MTREKVLRRTLPAAFLLLCALVLFFFSRYTKSGEDEAVALTLLLTDAGGWDIYTVLHYHPGQRRPGGRSGFSRGRREESGRGEAPPER